MLVEDSNVTALLLQSFGKSTCKQANSGPCVSLPHFMPTFGTIVDTSSPQFAFTGCKI